MDIKTLIKITSNERNSLKYLIRLRWSNGITCPKCINSNIRRINYRNKDLRYRCKKCRTRFTVFTNTYLANSKLKTHKLIQTVKFFTSGLSARATSWEIHSSYKTVLSLYDKIRQTILDHNQSRENLFGEVELDETYVGGKRKGKRGRSAKGKTPVFGMVERNGKVIVEVVPDVSSETLRQIIKERVSKDARVYTDKFKSYNCLIINGYDHIKIDKENTFANGKSHINSIESFWAYAKERLAKYHGISPKKLYLYMKELEFRFNYRRNDKLEETILKYLLDFGPYSG